jgi:hypothetical protein
VLEKATGFTIVSSDTIKRDIMREFVEFQSHIQKYIAETPGKVSFSLDLWTSVVVKAYIGVTIHFIDKSWNLRELTLDFNELEGIHSGEHIAEKLIDILDTYKISTKVCRTINIRLF